MCARPNECLAFQFCPECTTLCFLPFPRPSGALPHDKSIIMPGEPNPSPLLPLSFSPEEVPTASSPRLLLVLCLAFADGKGPFHSPLFFLDSLTWQKGFLTRISKEERKRKQEDAAMPFSRSSWRTYYHPAAKRRADGKRRSERPPPQLHNAHDNPRESEKEKPFLPPPLLGPTHPTPPPPPPPPASILSFSLFRSPLLLPLSSPGRASGTDDATKAGRGRKEGRKEKNLLLLRRHLPPPLSRFSFVEEATRRPCRVTALPLSRPFSPQFEVVAVAAAPPPPALSYLPKPGPLPLLLLQQSLQKGSSLPDRSPPPPR